MGPADCHGLVEVESVSLFLFDHLRTVKQLVTIIVYHGHRSVHHHFCYAEIHNAHD